MATGCHVKNCSKLYLSSYWDDCMHNNNIIIQCVILVILILAPTRVAYGSKNSSPYVHNLIGGIMHRMAVHMSEVECHTIS